MAMKKRPQCRSKHEHPAAIGVMVQCSMRVNHKSRHGFIATATSRPLFTWVNKSKASA